MLDWGKRITEWRVAVREYGRGHYLSMIVAILSGPVPLEVWQDRTRICLRCPILDRERFICRKVLGDGRTLGCNCNTTFLALTAAPYQRGCWVRTVTDNEGWPAFVFPTTRAKWRAVWRFIFPK